MIGRGQSFVEGVKASLSILLGVVPFGLICGAVCVASGMSVWGAIGLSIFVFAGASQLIAAQVLADGGFVGVAIVAALVINLRMLLYSASLLPHFKGTGFRGRALYSYLMTDQAFSVSINRFLDTASVEVNKPMYYLGSASLMWGAFNISTAVGAMLGPIIPEELGLEFVIPLTFIALVVPRLKDRPSLLAAVVAGLVAYFARDFAYSSGLLLAAVSGVGFGWYADRKEAARD